MSKKVETVENEPEIIKHKLTCFVALTIPLAIISNFIIPPKMFSLSLSLSLSQILDLYGIIYNNIEL